MNKKVLIVLFFITILGVILRFYGLGDYPSSLARDEVSVGYNAYSIIKTGKDEYGKILPIAFKAFGDWKLPVEVYLEIPGILIFGLNEFSTRFPEALLGSISIPLFFFVIKKILNGKEKLALFSALFLAISPWHIYMSRAAIGYNVLGLFFFLLGLYFFFNFIKGNKWSLLTANIFFILTLFSYTAFHIFTPLFLVGLFFLYRKYFSINKFIIFQLILFIIFYTLASISVLEANTQKIVGTSLWHDPKFYKTNVFDNLELHEWNTMAKMIHNKPLSFITKLSTNYLSTFSTEFLVIKGGENPINNLKNMGNMYIFEYILFIVGLLSMMYKRENFSKLVALWLAIGAIPAIFTREAPQSTRDLVLVPILSFLGGYGSINIMQYMISQKGIKKITLSIVIIFFLTFAITNMISFLDNYFIHMSKERGDYWNASYKEIVQFVNKKNPLKVVMGDQTRSPYIYFLFYNKYDPNIYLSKVKRELPTWDNFQHIKSFDKYYFVEDIDYFKDIEEWNTLYIDRLEKIPLKYPIDGIIEDKTKTYKYGWTFTDKNFCNRSFPGDRMPKICLEI